MSTPSTPSSTRGDHDQPSAHSNQIIRFDACHIHSLTAYALAWKELLPASKVIRKWSCAIFVCCITLFGFQKNATVVLVDAGALTAVVTACVASGIALLLAIIHKKVARRLHVEHALSTLLHTSAFLYLSLACVSLITFVARVVWTTAPRVFLTFCVACGLITGIAFTIMFHSFRAHALCRSSAGESEEHDLEAQSRLSEP